MTILLISYLHCFMDAGSRDEILGSEIKDFVTHGTASSMINSMLIAVPLVPCNKKNSKMVPEIPSSLFIHALC